MAGLKPFRKIPESIVEWTRWIREQDILVESNISIDKSQVSGLDTFVTSDSIKSGVGTPEGSVRGSIGNVYLRSDGGTSTSFYVKESGTNTTTGWVAK